MYYKGNPDDFESLSPMSHEEMIEVYRENSENSPEMLADIYLDFHFFERVEFHVFKDRLSSAIYVARASTTAASRDLDRLRAVRFAGEHRTPGWEAESDLLLDEEEGVVREAVEVAYGAAVLSAVAALETLVNDLLPSDVSSAGRKNLQRKVESFLRDKAISTDVREPIMKLVKTVSDRRNKFAHELIGSYWSRPSEPGKSTTTEFVFNESTFENTLFEVGEIALRIESLLP